MTTRRLGSWARRLALSVVMLALVFGVRVDPAFAERQQVLAATSVTTAGGAISATVGHDAGRGPAYLIVNTSAEAAAASLVVTASLLDSSGGTALLCTGPAITTNATTVILIGSLATAADGVAAVCDFPLAGSSVFTFTVTGAGAGFTVAADLVWVAAP